jgi:hypothetical protein
MAPNARRTEMATNAAAIAKPAPIWRFIQTLSAGFYHAAKSFVVLVVGAS